MAKRAHREGSIYQMKNGKWRAQISDPLGKRIGKVFDTQSACQDWIFETKSKMKKGLRVNAGQQNLSTFISRWLKSIKASRSPNTLSLYERTLKPVIDILGRFAINDIHPTNIQALYDKLLDDGMSAYSVRKIHKTLSSAFGHAEQMRLISENPISFVTAPKHVTKKMTCFDASQVQTLLLGSQTIKDHYFPLYYLAINTGMRQGELLGLKWKDIDWGKAELSIRRQLVMYADGNFELRPPKSRSGTRQIVVGKDVIDLLRNHQNQQHAKRIQKGTDWNELDLVFPSTFGTPVNASNLRRSFRKLLEFTGLPKIRFHDLRHTAATLMLNYGTPIPVVSQRLGHSKTSMTMDTYAHAIPSKQIEAAELMEELMTPISIPIAHGLHTKQK